MIAGIMGRKEQLLEAIFGSMRSSKEVTATSRRHHVATSPRRDVTKSRRRVNKLQKSTIQPRRDVTTSRRQLENLHLIIKCQRARKLGYWRTCGGRHEISEPATQSSRNFLDFSIVFQLFGLFLDHMMMFFILYILFLSFMMF